MPSNPRQTDGFSGTSASDQADSQAGTGWKIGTSITFELDIALAAIRDYSLGAVLPAGLEDLITGLPEAWRADLPPVVSSAHGYGSMLETAAFLAGVIPEDEYGRATLAIRELTPQVALERLEASLAGLGIEPDPALAVEPRLVDLGVRGKLAIYAQVGIEVPPDSQHALRVRRDFERACSIFSRSPTARQFWFWLDRFYFGYYHAWREQQRQVLLEPDLERVATALGAPVGNLPPAMGWLPPQNPLVQNVQLQAAVQAGSFQVYFWIEPFGLADSWSLFPGLVVVSCALPGKLFENFQERLQDVATRTFALADPTRLIILRLIRHFGLVNTEIATYLGISRPTVSIHAKILRQAGLIRSEQVGREVRHTIVPSEVHRLFRDLEQLLDLEPDQPQPTPKNHQP